MIFNNSIITCAYTIKEYIAQHVSKLIDNVKIFLPTSTFKSRKNLEMYVRAYVRKSQMAEKLIYIHQVYTTAIVLQTIFNN